MTLREISIIIFYSFCCPALGMPNPSAVYCEDLGYDYALEHGPDGDVGFCQVMEGKFYPSWDFFLGKNGSEYNYCGNNGYITQVLSDESCTYARECAFCVLPNGSAENVLSLMEKERNGTIASIENLEKSDPDRYSYYGLYTILFVILILTIYVFWRRAL